MKLKYLKKNCGKCLLVYYCPLNDSDFYPCTDNRLSEMEEEDYLKLCETFAVFDSDGLLSCKDREELQEKISAKIHTHNKIIMKHEGFKFKNIEHLIKFKKESKQFLKQSFSDNLVLRSFENYKEYCVCKQVYNTNGKEKIHIIEFKED